jgi:hypothetical protein
LLKKRHFEDAYGMQQLALNFKPKKIHNVYSKLQGRGFLVDLKTLNLVEGCYYFCLIKLNFRKFESTFELPLQQQQQQQIHQKQQM